MKKDIYSLELHETMLLEDGSATVLRVHNGWIYIFAYNSTVFVPYTEESFIPYVYREDGDDELDGDF